MEENEVKDVKVVEEKETKKAPKKDKNDILIVLRKIWNIVFWLLVLMILATWVVDFLNVKQSKDPQFCLKREQLTSEKGKVDACTGLGYKVYRYITEDELNGAIEFGPFWEAPRI